MNVPKIHESEYRFCLIMWEHQPVTRCACVLYFVYFWYENAINRDFANDYSAITLWDYILSLFQL